MLSRLFNITFLKKLIYFSICYHLLPDLYEARIDSVMRQFQLELSLGPKRESLVS